MLPFIFLVCVFRLCPAPTLEKSWAQFRGGGGHSFPLLPKCCRHHKLVTVFSSLFVSVDSGLLKNVLHCLLSGFQDGVEINPIHNPLA